MTQTDNGRGRRESPASPFRERGQSPEDRAKATLNAVLEHPFWGRFPKALSDGIDHIEQVFEKAEFDEVLADRVARALGLVVKRGKFGEPELAFLAAARAEFGGKESFVATTIDFVSTIASSIDPSDKKTPEQVRDRLDFARLVYVAARDKPELLDHLNDSAYRQLDPSVCNNPNLDALLGELLDKKLLTDQKHIDAVKVMLSPLRANWTADRCDEARRLFEGVGYLENIEFIALRRNIDRYRAQFPRIAAKLAIPAHAFRLFYPDETVLRFEFVCYTMHIARTSTHA